MNTQFEISRRATYASGMRVVRFLTIFVIALFATATAQAGSDWVVSSIKGDAKIVKAGVQPIALTTGDQLSEGDRIVTGETGRAVLTRDGSTIVVAPGSEMSIPVEKTGGLTTRILQKVGTLFLNVEKKKTEHFEVVTPYLAAVVKGTSFTVNVDAQGAAVHVLEGLVQVADAVSGQAVFVRPGQTATRGTAAGLDVKGNKAAAPGQNKKADTDTADAGNGNPGGNGKANGAESAQNKSDTGKANNGDKGNNNGNSIGKKLGVVTLDVAIVTTTLPGGGNGNAAANSNAGGNGNGNGNAGSNGNAGTNSNAGGNGNGAGATTTVAGAPGNSGGAPGNSGGAPGNSGGAPGNSGGAPGNSGGAPGNSGGAPGNNGNNGNSGNNGNGNN